MITITENVDTKIAEILKEENEPNLGLRVFVQGGGCSGMQYGFALETEQNEDDFVIEQQGVKYLVDAMSMQYLQGATIDYKEDFEGSNFVISNPNAQTSCGCGSSFSV
jgi:iron-sulfur cluster insertion protein